MRQLADTRCFGGRQLRFRHDSETCACPMTFSAYLPPAAAERAVPFVYWLSGLTCTDENFSTKSGAQRVAAELGLALIIPDTSPRGDHVPDDPDGNWDFGLGAGFYVDATQAPWSSHYRMAHYISRELPALVEGALPFDGRRAISGHSMGGHGALVLGLREPRRYAAISAFSPIVAPSEVPWGQKAFSRYLGEDREAWIEWDACRLLADRDEIPPILVDQGAADDFLDAQLQTWRLEQAVAGRDLPVTIRSQPGYDHSYYFIASFIEDHLRFLAEHMNAVQPTVARFTD